MQRRPLFFSEIQCSPAFHKNREHKSARPRVGTAFHALNFPMTIRTSVLVLLSTTPSTFALKLPPVASRRMAISALAVPLAAEAMLPGSTMLPGSGVSGGPWFTTSITPERKAEIRARRNGQSYVPNERVAWRECEPGDKDCIAKRRKLPSAQLAETLSPVSPEERSAAIKAQAASCRVLCDRKLPGSLR